MITEKEYIKKVLMEYNDVQIEIENLKKKIDKIQEQKNIVASVEGSSKFFPFTKTHYKINAINPKYNEELNKYLDILKIRKLELLKKLNIVEKFIEELPTSRLRLIFEYKYLHRFTWRKIAYKLGGNATEDSVRKEYERFFEER